MSMSKHEMERALIELLLAVAAAGRPTTTSRKASPRRTGLTGRTDGPVRWGRLASLARQGERGRPVWTAWTAMAGTEDTSRHQRLALGFWPLRRRTANF